MAASAPPLDNESTDADPARLVFIRRDRRQHEDMVRLEGRAPRGVRVNLAPFRLEDVLEIDHLRGRSASQMVAPMVVEGAMT